MDEKSINDKEFLALAKRAITEEFAKAGVDIKRILLFGSRARGDAKSDSDWDFLIIVPTQLPHTAKTSIVLAIQRMFGRMGIPVDIMVKSEGRIEAEKNDTGFLTRSAMAEGVPV